LKILLTPVTKQATFYMEANCT